MNQPTEAELPAIIIQLDDALHQLIGTRTMRDDQGTFTAPDLYTQLCTQLHDRPRRPGSKTLFESQPAVWIEGLSLKDEIDRTVRGWLGESGHTKTLLDRLTSVKWAPNQVVWLRDVARRIDRWARQIADLLADRATELNLVDPCPASLDKGVCGATLHYRRVDNEDVRTTALVVHLDAAMAPTGAECRVCGTTWRQEHILWFGGLLHQQREGIAA